jgi:hypothetical protein
MKNLTYSIGVLLAVVLLWPSPRAGAAPAPAQPRISEIRFEGGDLLVVADVPEGVVRIVLEGCQSTGARAWVPRAVHRVSRAGRAVFRVSHAAAERMEMFRVRADDQDPLPARFYSGPTEFRGSLQSEMGGAMTPYTLLGDPLAWNVAAVDGPGDGVLRLEQFAAAPPPEASGVLAAAPREVVESDLWRVRGDTLYFFNSLRGLQKIDLSDPEAPVLQATFPIPASGEDMYVIDDHHVVLLARAQACDPAGLSSTDSAVIVIDAGGSILREVARVPLSGQLVESRFVGTALYLATQTWQPKSDRPEDAGVWTAGTVITGIDLASPANPVAQPELWLPGSGNVVTATDRYLFVAMKDHQPQMNWWETVLKVIDISDPTGVLSEFGTIPLAGEVKDKFKIHLDGDVLAVIAAGPKGGEFGGRWRSELSTYQLKASEDPAWARLGSVEVGHGEDLFATRFEGDRAYIVTFRRIDPLWVVDLSEPETPRVLGELEIPGWSTYIHPLGDRLLTMGIDDTMGNRAAVQWFDVSDPSRPRLLSKVVLGTGWSSSEANQTEKALGVFPETGLVLVPFSSENSAGIHQQGVKLLDLERDTLVGRGVIEGGKVVPRRSTLRGDRILALSGRELITVDASDRDEPSVRHVLELAHPVERVLPMGDWLLEFSEGSVRVREVNGAEGTAREFALGEMRVMGATLRNGLVYLLQGRASQWGWEEDKWQVTTPGQIKLSVFDAGALPELSVMGSVTEEVAEISDGPHRALWPRPGVLVWDGPEYYPQGGPGTVRIINFAGRVDPWNGGVINFVPVDTPGVPVRTGSFLVPRLAPGGVLNVEMASFDFITGFWLPWHDDTSAQRDLLVFDVAASEAPRLAAQVKPPEDAIGRSAAHAIEGLVLFSHDTTHQEVTGTNTYTSTSRRWVTEPREVLVTNVVRVPYETLVTNVVEKRALAAGWIQRLPGVSSIAAGRFHVLGLTAAGEVLGWGDNRSGQLGSEGLSAQLEPQPIVLPGPAADIAAAAWFSLARLVDGSVLTWGSPDGPPPPPVPGAAMAGLPPHLPRPIAALGTGTVDLEAGYGHALALDSAGTLFAWGRNDRGQLGLGDVVDRDTPEPVTSSILMIRAAGLRSLALTRDGRVLAWGDNRSGQLGGAPGESVLTPEEVPALSGIEVIAAGDSHSLALDESGRVWSWGMDSATGDGPEPRVIEMLPAARAIAAGEKQSLALDGEGTVWSWGTHSDAPLRVEGLPAIRQIRASGGYAVALGEDETAYLWSHGNAVAPRTRVPMAFQMSRITGTNVTTGTAYRLETNVTTRIVQEGRWEEVTVTNSYPVYRTWTRHHLDVLDFNGDSDPLLRPAASLPGPLLGVSHQGSLVYTLGSRADEDDPNVSRAWLEAGAYDGVAVHLVASLEVASHSRGESAVAKVDPRGFVLLARRDEVGTNTVGSLVLGEDGQFAVLDLETSEAPASELILRDDILVVNSGGVVSLFEVDGDGLLRPVGIPFELGCLIPSLDRVEGDRESGLWVPLGDYGSARVGP